MVPLKRRKTLPSDAGNTVSDSSGHKVPNKFSQVVLFLLERKMGASRKFFLSQLGRNKGFQVEDVFSESVTHVISENNCGTEVRTWLKSQGRGQSLRVHLLDVSWYTESMRAGYPVEITHRHKLQEQQISEAEVALFSVSSYACQRRTTLDNHNSNLTDALSLLAENAELNNEDGRGVAFRRAAALLKALPTQDVLENGVSSEVESTKQSKRYKALKILTGIFGVGAKTADRWIRAGIYNLEQLRHSGQTLNRAQKAGLEHYDDLNEPVTKAEADAIGEIVQKAVDSVLTGSQVALSGGFRRGKLTGHDVDFLITHPEEGKEVGLMPKVVAWLESQGFLLYQKTTRNSYLESKDGPARPASNMDRFERCFSIFKLTKGKEQESTQPEEQNDLKIKDVLRPHMQADTDQQLRELSKNYQMEAASHKIWRAVRVDLVVSPISQFAFAVLGWTGSKLFERELRRWAGHEKNMSLSSHALFDNTQNKYLRATSEEEIFAYLGLEYIPPSERNA
ncbi:DNA-directed DNA/RNA polymerase mu isoform X2 [Neolamprologus brichardi]|uniref:DNA-directed DNA/RNA polymerase mu isoform X2 n=1 Tax=Neolamprologus brichardi TaxID=32507 RepID=UPI001643A584|nr:DNA-directed DNA/RNA polymerase mu isoform X2 [Neolamprologus brichardi]